MFLGIPWTEWLGYAASLVVAIALLMKSLIRLRWINLAGSALFAVYGFLIQAWPVAGFNTVIVFINLFYLVRMYGTRENFELMEIRPGDPYLRRFLDVYRGDLGRIFPLADIDADPLAASPETVGFYILRDLATAGIFVGTKTSPNTLDVLMDYVTPAYRDFKTGRFLFVDSRGTWSKLGIDTMTAHASDTAHNGYLRRMGFVQEGDRFLLRLGEPMNPQGEPINP